MKRAVIIFSVLTCLVVLSIQYAAAQVASFQTTITQNANMRGGPGTDFDQISVATAGTSINLDGRNENGNWVRGITSRGTVGWVSSGTVSITYDQLIGLRVVRVETAFTLAAPEQAAPAGQPTGPGSADGTLVTATTNVNMRSGPGTSFRRVGGLGGGAPLNVDGRDAAGNWVRGINQSGTIGWVSAGFLTIGDGINNLPVVGTESPFTLSAPGGGPAPAAPVAAAPVGQPVRGFSYGGHVQGFNQTAANYMRNSGMTWVKKQWRYVDGQNPQAAAGLINDIQSRGFRVMLGVIGQNPRDINNPGYFERYAAFVAGLAAQGVDAIEIWNEPNIDREWPAGQINPATYTQLLRQSYNAIKAANPNTLVISGAPAPTGFFGGCTGAGCDDDAFLRGMAAAGAVNAMDCIGIHYNEGIVPPQATSGDPRGNSGHYTRYLRSMMNVYSGAFGNARPLCFTELGYLSPEGFPPLPQAFAWAQNVTVGQQALWLRDAINITRNSGRVRVVIIWNIDFTNYGADPMAGYAIIRPDGGCPACQALSN